MKYLNIETAKRVYDFLRRYISPAYIMMFIAAFVLWYITKLGDTYTTEHTVTVVIDGKPYEVDCTIRGKGTDMIGYTMSSRRSRFDISSSELTYDQDTPKGDGVILRHISTVSLQQALAARMSDIEVVAVGSLPPVEVEVAEVEQGGPSSDAPTTPPPATITTPKVSFVDDASATSDKGGA